ncbi:hypothetical protein B484DRAFT_408361 [Ochromonadaceae sp. CCMP2298]|nr:hypothetical protein B484DRAFT_408361 [Ochromonadaceae sp. CCMP2298]
MLTALAFTRRLTPTRLPVSSLMPVSRYLVTGSGEEEERRKRAKRESQRLYYEKNKDAISQQQKGYYEENKGALKQKAKLRKKEKKYPVSSEGTLGPLLHTTLEDHRYFTMAAFPVLPRIGVTAKHQPLLLEASK